jgi:hypothetical protein
MYFYFTRRFILLGRLTNLTDVIKEMYFGCFPRLCNAYLNVLTSHVLKIVTGRECRLHADYFDEILTPLSRKLCQ